MIQEGDWPNKEVGEAKYKTDELVSKKQNLDKLNECESIDRTKEISLLDLRNCFGWLANIFLMLRTMEPLAEGASLIFAAYSPPTRPLLRPLLRPPARRPAFSAARSPAHPHAR